MNVVEAWNEISWVEAIPFLLVLAFVYWGKLKLDARVGSVSYTHLRAHET